MLSGLIFKLSPARRRFMRELAAPGLAKFNRRLDELGSQRAVKVVTTLNHANADFMAYALCAGGPLAGYRANATPDAVEACLSDLLIYSINLFARAEMARDSNELLRLVAGILQTEPMRVTLKRDSLRKTPHSEEWALYMWLVKDLGGPPPSYDPHLERSFGYQYLSYIGQFRSLLERQIEDAGCK